MWALKILGKFCFKHYFINSEHNQIAISVLFRYLAQNSKKKKKKKKKKNLLHNWDKKLTMLLIIYQIYRNLDIGSNFFQKL